VRFTAPADGGFFEWGKPLSWTLEASDAEDGVLPAEKILVQMEKRNRAASDDDVVPSGLALMRRTTCFACHSTLEKSAGPPYSTIAGRYAADPAAPARLSAKVLSGGTGVWGELPMPPHPQHTPAEAAQMIDWILSLSQRRFTTLPPGKSGSIELIEPKKEWGRAENGVVVLTASAVDGGAGPVPPQRGEARLILRSRRQRAAFFDAGHLAAAQDNLDQGGLVARVASGGWIGFDGVRLADVGGLRLHAWPQGAGPLTVRVHADSVNGPLLAKGEAAPGGSTGRSQEILLPLATPKRDGRPRALLIFMEGPPGSVLEILWVDFVAPE
jgi:cytochrome c